MELPKVIYVDDEPGLLEITKVFLEESGDIQVDTEQSSLNVPDILKNVSYDVIVSDYQMPGMNGLELLKALRAGGDLTPFILFTGRGREEVAIKALNSGADFYIQKGGNPRVQFGELKNAIVQLAQRKNAERQVTQSEQKYRDLVEGASSIILKLDAEGRITFLNQFGKEYFGCTDDVIGEPMFGALIRPEEYSGLELGEIKRAFSEECEQDSSSIFPIRRRDGTKTWANWNTRARRDKCGRIRETLVIGNDVTAVKNAEMELQKLMSQLRAMLDSSEEGVLLIDSNSDVIQCNQRLMEMWDIPDALMRTRSSTKLFEFARDQLQDPDAFISYIERTRGSPGRESRRLLEFKDGRVYDEHFMPVIIGSSVIGCLLTFKEHPPKNAEVKVNDSELAFNELYNDNLAVILFVESGTGDIVDANDAACRFYGYDHDSMKEMNISRDIETSADFLERSRLAVDGVHRFPSRHRTAGREIKDVEVFTRPVTISGRKLLLTMVQDMTEMSRARRLFDKLEIRDDEMLDLVGEGIIIVDQNDRIVYANHRLEDILKMPSSEIINTTTLSHVAPVSLEQAASNQRRRSEGHASQSDYRMKRGDGSEFWAMVSARPVIRDGRFAGTTYFVTDVNERRQREECLKAREENYRQIIKNAPGGIWTVDREWNNTFVNDNMASILGYPKEELRKSSMLDLMDPSSRRSLALRPGDPRAEVIGEHEIGLVRSDGSIVQAHLSAYSVHYGNGELAGFVAIASDGVWSRRTKQAPGCRTDLEKLVVSISARLNNSRVEEIDAILTDSLQEIALSIGAERGHIFLFDRDAGTFDGAYTWSKDGTEPWKVTSAPLSGDRRSWWMSALLENDILLIQDVEELPPEAEEKRVDLLSRDVRALVTIPMVAERSPMGLLSFDSSEVGVELSAADMDMLRAVGSFFVSALQRKNAALALEEASGQYWSSMDSLSEGIYVIDRGYLVVFANKTFIELMKEFELDVDIVGRNVFEIMPFMSDRVRSEFDQVFRGGKPVMTEEMITLNGRRVIISVRKFPMWSQGAIDKVLVYTHDITERRMLEESLNGASRKLNLLYNITRHDINNQLLVLRGHLDMLREHTKESACLERLGAISACAESIWRQIEFTKTYQEMGTKLPQWQEMGALIDGLSMDSSGIERLEVSPRLRDVEIYGDPMLGKVFHNLLEDSAKYAADPTIVKLDCRESDKHLIITYEDVGPGVSPEDKERIFQNGYGRGTGFGLFLSREVLAITGMTISETGEPGKGARFEITVPPGHYSYSHPDDQGLGRPRSRCGLRVSYNVHHLDQRRQDREASDPLV